MATKYAKDQAKNFSNHIQRVVITGVRILYSAHQPKASHSDPFS